ncbi:MAG: DUF4124 domain-containing protein [Hahellaceae bacterium]|nr:DUF4124 domain-containing protein [Hahellaceae bacterium]MCP5210634.1 DUF4124 domain-containing protein [Hahellaceae bacterium]
MNIKKLFAGSLLIMLPLAAGAETVQKWVDDKGQVHFSDQKPQSTQVQSTEVTIKKSLPPGGEEAVNQQKQDSESDNGNYFEDETDPDANRANRIDT